MSGHGEHFVTDTLQTIRRVHNRNAECDLGCVIHNPSKHHRDHLPIHWSNERMMMVRIAPDGSWLTDPDEMAWRERHPGHPYKTGWEGFQ